MTNVTQRETNLLARTWGWLCTGSARIIRAHSDEQQHHLELARANGPSVTGRELDTLLPVLLGKAPKAVAADQVRSNSSVTSTAATVLKRIGFDCRPNDVPMIAVMLARAGAAIRPSATGVEVALLAPPENDFVLSIARPETWLCRILTPSERRVTWLRIEGFSYDQAASVCAVSKRTIANHVANVYRKLGVSARIELLNRILDDGEADRVFAPKAAAPRLSWRDGGRTSEDLTHVRSSSGASSHEQRTRIRSAMVHT